MARRPALTPDELAVMKQCKTVIVGMKWELDDAIKLPVVLGCLSPAHHRLCKLGWLRTLMHSSDPARAKIVGNGVPWRLALTAAGGVERERLVEQGKI